MRSSRALVVGLAAFSLTLVAGASAVAAPDLTRTIRAAV